METCLGIVKLSCCVNSPTNNNQQQKYKILKKKFCEAIERK
jgi:hypothetical protein